MAVLKARILTRLRKREGTKKEERGEWAGCYVFAAGLFLLLIFPSLLSREILVTNIGLMNPMILLAGVLGVVFLIIAVVRRSKPYSLIGTGWLIFSLGSYLERSSLNLLGIIVIICGAVASRWSRESAVSSSGSLQSESPRSNKEPHSPTEEVPKLFQPPKLLKLNSPYIGTEDSSIEGKVQSIECKLTITSENPLDEEFTPIRVETNVTTEDRLRWRFESLMAPDTFVRPFFDEDVKDVPTARFWSELSKEERIELEGHNVLKDAVTTLDSRSYYEVAVSGKEFLIQEKYQGPVITLYQLPESPALIVKVDRMFFIDESNDEQCELPSIYYELPSTVASIFSISTDHFPNEDAIFDEEPFVKPFNFVRVQ